jgi:hypothetical protein
MNQWEYKTIKFKTDGFLGGKINEEQFEEELNRFGYDGWELVSCFDRSMSQGRQVLRIQMLSSGQGEALKLPGPDQKEEP